jgi:hypothetical protein
MRYTPLCRVLALSLPLLCPGVATARARPAPPSATPVAAQATGTVTLAADAEARWVAFDLTPGNQIRFAMTVDGRAATAILDTGVSFSLLARKSPLVSAAKVRPGGSATAIGGAVAIGWMPTQRIAIGGLTRTGGGVTVADLPALATGSATPVDMLVGRDLVGTQALEIDYAAKRFRLIASGRLPFTGATAPLTVSDDRRVYESAITLGGRTLAPMVVDTGDGSAITVTDPGWRMAGLTGLRTTTAVSFGLAGAVTSRLAIVPALGLGTLTARSVEVRIEPAGGFSQAIGAAGRIGSGFLQNYHVLLDPRAGRMVLSPGPGADRAPLRSTSGVLLGIEPDRLKILHVMAGGPAEAAGWKAGELICAIDGTAIGADYATGPLAAWSIGAPGTVVRIGMCDGTTRALTLRAFY